MSKLQNTSERFHVTFTVIEGGVGVIRGTLSAADQNEQPAYIFIQPRHVLRTPPKTPLKPGMVLRTPSGDTYLVGDNGPAETWRGALWQSFRLFATTGRYVLARRGVPVEDKITGAMKNSTDIVPVGSYWAAVEPLDRPQNDREMRVEFEQRRVIAGVTIKEGDTFDNQTVVKVDKQLGLSIGVLS